MHLSVVVIDGVLYELVLAEAEDFLRHYEQRSSGIEKHLHNGNNYNNVITNNIDDVNNNHTNSDNFNNNINNTNNNINNNINNNNNNSANTVDTNATTHSANISCNWNIINSDNPNNNINNTNNNINNNNNSINNNNNNPLANGTSSQEARRTTTLVSHAYLINSPVQVHSFIFFFSLHELGKICMLGVLSLFRRDIVSMATTYLSGTHSVAYVTVPNEEVGQKIARLLVEKQLAACVNMMPRVKSIYSWKGNIEEDNELLLIIKTRTSRIDDLSKFIRENHPYEVAEVISMKIDNGNPPYLDWLSQSVPDK
ncbi:hypothetical protein HELRODRAFT_169296 [Helobdella robusta]|uniref:Protein CutA n=1 Tax=Helobdella robusta TaxID=6412 RepID=T1F1R0_HELRO|nr:hypothetical protein HELRODRAFT_169296 [Helobdella robusta]ESO08451.1 hypothetical protein HELRODRAFT_169296 [Helobdella robusta]